RTARQERDTAIQQRDRYFRHREALRAKYGETGAISESGTQGTTSRRDTTSSAR
ncbi:hypothetical protein KI387_036635, partial [Taxus chinensis]